MNGYILSYLQKKLKVCVESGIHEHDDFDCGGEDYPKQMPTDNENFKISKSFTRLLVLFLCPKNIIGLFRKMIQMDNYFEEIARKMDQLVEIEKALDHAERKEDMEIEGFEDLPKLFISPIEQLMDELKGSVKEFRALFKIPKETYL